MKIKELPERKIGEKKQNSLIPSHYNTWLYPATL